MKKFMKLTSLILCIAMLTSTLAGCGWMYGLNELPDNEDEETTESDFNPPYLENYYVNKHEPVKIDCNINVRIVQDVRTKQTA